MHPFDDDYLSKMLPGYEKKPRPAPTTPPRQEPTISEAAEKAPPQEPSAPELFDSIAAYISKYLACDQHQLTVLTLWVGYTRFFKAFFTAVYLNICSPQPQSGKSTCLMLLNALVGKPSFITGASPATLMNFLLTKTNQVDGNKFESTLFLDDCHHTFGPSERQPVVALLNSGSDASPCYFSGALEYYLFGPKAFAGNASLPRSLAARCIPITLRRRKSTDQIARLHPLEAHKHGLELVSKLVPWINNNRAAIEKVAPTSPPRIPQGHTPREQACAEPLIHLADLIGGSWPEKARRALSHIFRLAEGTTTVELLCDMRSLFYSKGDPEFIATKEILGALRGLEHRPWGAWTANSGKRLGALLGPLGITSRFLNRQSTAMNVYYFKHFQDAWDRYIPPITVQSNSQHPSNSDSNSDNFNDSNRSSQTIGILESNPLS